MGISTLSLLMAACTGDEEQTQQLSDASRAALAVLGVADIEGDGHPFLLIDEDGERIGELSIGESSTQATLFGNTVRTTRTEDLARIECNGASVVYSPADATIDADARALVGPCGDALAAATAVMAPEWAHAPVQFRDLTTCQGLGTNQYCDGSTLVLNNDWLCNKGGEQWVETWHAEIENASACTS